MNKADIFTNNNKHIFTRLTASFPHGQMHFLRLRIHNANVKRDRGNHENMKKKHLMPLIDCSFMYNTRFSR